jgi:hypothetical protein
MEAYVVRSAYMILANKQRDGKRLACKKVPPTKPNRDCATAYNFRKTFKSAPPRVDAWFDRFVATSNAITACDTTLRNRYNPNWVVAVR